MLGMWGRERLREREKKKRGSRREDYYVGTAVVYYLLFFSWLLLLLLSLLMLFSLFFQFIPVCIFNGINLIVVIFLSYSYLHIYSFIH